MSDLRKKAEAATQGETALQRHLIAVAELHGWLVFHAEKSARKVGERWIRNQPRTGAGFPDLVLLHVRRHLLVFAELKGDKGPRGGQRGAALTEAQEAWLDGLAHISGIRVEVWRPADLDAVYRLLVGA